MQVVGLHSTMDSIHVSLPAAPGLILSVPNLFRNFLMLLRLIDSSAPLRVWTVQKMPKIVHRTHLALASGELVP